MSVQSDFTIPNDIDTTNIPKHVAIIMDGNGTWAKQRNKLRNAGHKEGRNALKRTVKNCRRLGITTLSVYAFSTENWKRPKKEISFLLSYLKTSITEELNELVSEETKVQFLGDLSPIDATLKSAIHDIEQKTAKFDTFQLNIMFNYGGRAEIIHAVKQYALDGHSIHNLTEDALSQYLYTSTINDPDILIRTSGTQRISNFMIWQCSYTEFFFIDTLWPDFDMDDLVNVIRNYQQRERRFGGVSE